MAINYATKTIRLLTREHTLLTDAVQILQEREPAASMSPLVYTAGLEEAHRLGIWTGSPPPPPLKGEWANTPDRRDDEGSTRERITVTLHPDHEWIMDRAAEYVNKSFPIYSLGSTFRYLANLKLANVRFEKSKDQAERARFNPKLKTLRLPKKFEPFPADFDRKDPDWV
ncbi:hypothetical protein HUA74_43950 [Myxococcus sp. CA051A]|uniref:hypothetical protein n=1 Tax=Myxococcus sp. CA051A TaxID=2741739 RepID=UPI00157B9DE7|nr:hypothetical protein [Myxococcus sp. CA051A]NTX67623.1 hypothetical protein [Myxococcus sp. CA051A]